MPPEIIFTPTDFIATLNQTLEFAYPLTVIEGELANFRISKNRWVYFDLKDETAKVPFFGTIYSLPGPLEDGLTVRVVGSPRMHPLFGFSVSFQSILPVGQGSLKKAADLLLKKLSAEGLFDQERKRSLPIMPTNVGLITAAGSAAAADFTKILNERWGGVEVTLADVYVQGELAVPQIVEAIEYLNGIRDMPEVLVITRGGGSAEDLAAFNDERLVRAVAASRIPTLVAIGHEVDVSLAELAADQRASTPSNAVQILVPDKNHQIVNLKNTRSNLSQMLQVLARSKSQDLQNHQTTLSNRLENLFIQERQRLQANYRLIKIFDPRAALKRGYALVTKNGKFIKSVKQVQAGDHLSVQLADGTMEIELKKVTT